MIYRVTDLKINPTNVAIPTSLIDENDQGQLVFTFYVQLSDSFLSRRDLQLAVKVNVKLATKFNNTVYWY